MIIIKLSPKEIKIKIKMNIDCTYMHNHLCLPRQLLISSVLKPCTTQCGLLIKLWSHVWWMKRSKILFFDSTNKNEAWLSNLHLHWAERYRFCCNVEPQVLNMEGRLFIWPIDNSRHLLGTFLDPFPKIYNHLNLSLKIKKIRRFQVPWGN